MKNDIKAGDYVRITSRMTKQQQYVKLGTVYIVLEVGKTKSGANVLVLANKQMKGGKMRINSERFGWERITVEQLKAQKHEAQFRQEVKSDVERILNAFTMQEHVQITFVPLVLNEVAWHFAFRAIKLGAIDRVQDLKKLSRVLRQLREHYERLICKDLLPSDFERIHKQTMEFMQENAYHFQIMYYTASNVFSKQYGKQPFEEMRVNALLSMLVMQYTDEHNKRCDMMLEQRLGKIQAAKRMPDMDSLYSGMDAFSGELPVPFNFADTNLQMCLGVLRNNLLKCEWVISDK